VDHRLVGSGRGAPGAEQDRQRDRGQGYAAGDEERDVGIGMLQTTQRVARLLELAHPTVT
jgi:hypothetical protein